MSDRLVPVHNLHVFIAQEAAGCTHHICDGDFLGQPVGRDERIQLSKKQVNMNPSISRRTIEVLEYLRRGKEHHH